MMYNESQKMKYIEEMKERNASIENIMMPFFNRSEKLETSLSKDCSEFNIDDIFDLLRNVDTYSFNYLNNMVSQLKLYTSWCISNARTETYINHYQLMTAEMIRGCVNDIMLKESIITREKLDYYLSVLINPADKFILLASFEGMKIEEIMTCTIGDLSYQTKEKGIIKALISTESDEDIDFGIIRIGGKECKVSKELIKIGIESYEETESYPQKYIGEKRDDFSNKQRKGFKKDDERIIKAMLNSRVDEENEDNTILAARFRYKMRRIKEIADDALCMSWKNLQLSGIVYSTKVALRSQDEYKDIKSFLFEKYYSVIEEKFEIQYPMQRLYEKYGKYFEDKAE